MKDAPSGLLGQELVNWVHAHRMSALEQDIEPDTLSITIEQERSLLLLTPHRYDRVPEQTILGVPFSVALSRWCAPILATLLLSISTAALAQAPPPNPFSCADFEFFEPGWQCEEHFGFAFPDWGSISWNGSDFDRKGNLYRTEKRDVVSPEPAFCGPYLNQGVHLFRYEPGYSWENQGAKKLVGMIQDKCVSGTWTAVIFSGFIRAVDGALLVRLGPRIVDPGYGASWVVRLSRSEPAVLPSPPDDDTPSADLSLGRAGFEQESLAPRPAVRRHE